MLDTLKDELQKVSSEAQQLIAGAKSVDDLRAAESRLMGRQGSLGKLLSSIGKFPPEHRGAAGKEINLAKVRIAGASCSLNSWFPAVASAMCWASGSSAASTSMLWVA